jgi:hypothetical protein
MTVRTDNESCCGYNEDVDLINARGIAARCWCDPRTSGTVMDPVLAEVFAETVRDLISAGEMLWVVLANVSGGNWNEQSMEWQTAAEKWRDNFFATLRKYMVTP